MQEGFSSILADHSEEFRRILDGNDGKVVITITGAELLALMKYQENVGYRKAFRSIGRGLDEDLVSREEVREALGVSNNTLSAWKRYGRIVPVAVIGRKEFYRRSDLEEMAKY